MEYSNKLRILLVDDEAELTTPLSRVLHQEGYAVDLAQDGEQGLELARRSSYHLLILDWMMPQISGIELCQALRQQGDRTPVLFLTAKDTLDDRVEGLDAGADDYLVKPFELRELLARVRALLRRPANLAPPDTAEGATGTRLSFEDLELDPDNRTARRRGRSIDLSEKETLLLTYLMQHPAELLTHEAIQAFLWGGDRQPSSNVLAAQIRLLRRKIEAPSEPPLIHTVYGRGYRLSSSNPVADHSTSIASHSSSVAGHSNSVT